MAHKPIHKWKFKPGLRAGAFGWRGSAKAIERLKSANSEIRAVGRSDPVAAAEGVIALAERVDADTLRPQIEGDVAHQVCRATRREWEGRSAPMQSPAPMTVQIVRFQVSCRSLVKPDGYRGLAALPTWKVKRGSRPRPSHCR
ncbi:hypothetical protein K1T73_10535 [Roseovarius sp. SCSIO 43702]|uniref:hypothetical protein n=1 Tax=Roseovarius sp. SCSIO 43702 TaxID=2823043 RepID=UPI001C738270|nr:hypothetical protein [Roseovarius sp. SCSIO 43702]QYX55536.1 hypothetical protein K1T73_10535 [Roseovarius sp. SCSIO 43702]